LFKFARKAAKNFMVGLHFLCVFVAAKIENQRTLLMRNHPDLPPTVPVLLNETIKSVQECSSIEEIRGQEGYAAKLYFEHFGGLFKSEEGKLFQNHGRIRRPPPDPINATISFAYSMLVHECTAALRLSRLDPSLGALHVARPGRPALSLDLMEPFRILIADSVAVSAFNRREFSPGHFVQTAAGCTMTEYGRKAFFSAYGRRMETEVRHPVFGYKLSYRRMLALHAKMIAAWFRGEMKTLSFLTTR
jgi:CRISPR-associated protein Cas1